MKSLPKIKDCKMMATTLKDIASLLLDVWKKEKNAMTHRRHRAMSPIPQSEWPDKGLKLFLELLFPPNKSDNQVVCPDEWWD